MPLRIPVVLRTLTIKFSDQVAAGTVNVSYIDETVKTVLRVKFALGLFESAVACLVDSQIVY